MRSKKLPAGAGLPCEPDDGTRVVAVGLVDAASGGSDVRADLLEALRAAAGAPPVVTLPGRSRLLAVLPSDDPAAGISFLETDDAVGAKKCEPSTGFFDLTDMARPSGFAGCAGGAISFRAADEAVGAVRCARCAVRTGDLALAGTPAGEPWAAVGLLFEALRRLALSLDVLRGVFAEGRRDGDGFGDDFEADALVDWRYAGTRGDFAGVVPLT